MCVLVCVCVCLCRSQLLAIWIAWCRNLCIIHPPVSDWINVWNHFLELEWVSFSIPTSNSHTTADVWIQFSFDSKLASELLTKPLHVEFPKIVFSDFGFFLNAKIIVCVSNPITEKKFLRILYSSSVHGKSGT